MAAACIQFYQSPMVHTSSPYQLPTPLRANPTVQLPTLSSTVPASASPRRTRGASLNGERKPLSARPRTNTRPKVAPGMIDDQESSLFFRLPAELRNDIYKELLCPDTPTPAQLAHGTNEKGEDLSVKGFNRTCTDMHVFPAILSTCHRIHDEAVGLLYSHNTFHAHPNLLNSLPHLTTPEHPVLYSNVSNLIKRWQISLRLDTDPHFTHEQVTAAFSGAEYLEIRVWQAQFEACDFAILKLFTGVRGVGLARVGGSVDEDIARALEHLMMSSPDNDCGCGAEEDEMDWEGKREVLCGRCYKKVECEWNCQDCDDWHGFGRK